MRVNEGEPTRLAEIIIGRRFAPTRWLATLPLRGRDEKANAALLVFFAAPGRPASLFPFPLEGNGAPGGRQRAGEAPLGGFAATRRASGETREPSGARARRPPGAPSVKLAQSAQA